MKWEKIKNFVIGGGAAFIMVLLLGFLDWRAQVHASTLLESEQSKLAINALIDAKISSIDFATDEKIVDMDSDRQANTHNIETNTENITINRDDVRRAFCVLMGGEC